jgi:hypothetical protein
MSKQNYFIDQMIADFHYALARSTKHDLPDKVKKGFALVVEGLKEQKSVMDKVDPRSYNNNNPTRRGIAYYKKMFKGLFNTVIPNKVYNNPYSFAREVWQSCRTPYDKHNALISILQRANEEFDVLEIDADSYRQVVQELSHLANKIVANNQSDYSSLEEE